MMALLLAMTCAVISGGVGLVSLGAAMIYGEDQKMVDLRGSMILLVVALVFAFGSGWAARGGV